MKKAFTMIELIFVIVILGILASVAIPRLAATREDAEISTAVANLRTLVSDINSYYVVKGSFTGVKWNEITNAPLKNADSVAMGSGRGGNAATLTVGGKDCMGLQLISASGNTPAHILFIKYNGATGACKQVLEAEPVKAYVDNSFSLTNLNNKSITVNNAIPIGSSTSVYPSIAPTRASRQ
nr:type II secretion system protein [uncultured Campylobacter sp.]